MWSWEDKVMQQEEREKHFSYSALSYALDVCVMLGVQ